MQARFKSSPVRQYTSTF